MFFPQGLFGKEADKLEHANDDERIYYLIEKEPLVNKFISVPKDKGSLNCAMFIAGIIEAVLNAAGFVSNIWCSNNNCILMIFCLIKWTYLTFQTAKVTAHWHKGTTYMVTFEESVIAKDKQLDERWFTDNNLWYLDVTFC